MSVSKKASNETIKADRLKDLQQKVHDKDYMEAAIQRIALVLSRRLVENNNTIRIQ